MHIVVAQPARSSADSFAEVFQALGCLKRYLIWARTTPPWLQRELLVTNLGWGALRALGPILLPAKLGESWQYFLHPAFGRWAARHVEPGDAVFSSFGYCNEAFHKARRLGGTTLYNAGNSHPQFMWDILTEEHARWNVRADPFLRRQLEQALEMVGLTDYFFCPSSFVRQSFAGKGFAPDRLITAARTFNPQLFKPAELPGRPGPFRVVCPGGVGLRKGTVYLLQAFEKLRREFKDCELILTHSIREDARPVIRPYHHLVTWVDAMDHAGLARFFQGSDVYVLPSLEEGLARTGLEAMACGVPVIVTPNTGVNDYVVEGRNGFVVPIRDPQAIFEKLLWLATHPEARQEMGRAAALAMQQLRPERFAETVAAGLQAISASRTGPHQVRA